jgi:hypothetical protein
MRRVRKLTLYLLDVTPPLAGTSSGSRQKGDLPLGLGAGSVAD